jgi:hypothetical protein
MGAHHQLSLARLEHERRPVVGPDGLDRLDRHAEVFSAVKDGDHFAHAHLG